MHLVGLCKADRQTDAGYLDICLLSAYLSVGLTTPYEALVRPPTVMTDR